MKQLLWLLPVAMIGAGVWWIVAQKNAPPEVPYTVAKSGSLVDTLATNGKVEPEDFTGVRAERAAAIVRLFVDKGQFVRAGQVLAELSNPEAATAREAAEARVAQIQAELTALEGGGRAADIASIDGDLTRLSLERRQMEQELEAVERLIARNAATKQEAQVLRDKIAGNETQRKALAAKRSALFTDPDRRLIEERLREARTAVAAAQQRVAQSELRSPIAGTVYQLDRRAGDYLNPGDLLCSIGKVDRLVVKVFVDEPELGRVAIGMPVNISWDAMPGKEWPGTVERMPVQIVAMGTRQVGEVTVKIDNSERLLAPGANINAAIRSRQVSTAVLIPKECLRRDGGGEQGVYVIENENAKWRPVKIGVTNVTHAQVAEGVKAGDRVVLATDVVLRDGQPVNAVSGEGR